MPEYAIEADPGKCTASFPTFDNLEAAVAAATVPAMIRDGSPPRVLVRMDDETAWSPVASVCTRRGCGRLRSEHDYGEFCP